jgi:hypothetical protein
MQIELVYQPEDGGEWGEWAPDEYIRVEVTVDSMENLDATIPILIWAEKMKRGTRLGVSREALPEAVAAYRRHARQR